MGSKNAFENPILAYFEGGTANCPDFHIVPISSLVPIYQNHFSKKSPFSLGFRLVLVYRKNGDKFFKSNSDFRKSNVTKEHQ